MQRMFKKVIVASVCMLAMFGNAQVSQAEVRTYDGVGEYIMSDFETPDIAKQRAKARAEQHAAEQAGVYVKSYTRMVNHTLLEDEIVAIANTIIKIVDVQYTTNPTSEGGGSFQIVAKIRAAVDSNRIDEWLKRDQAKNQELVEQNKQLQADKAKLDAELIELRKKLNNIISSQEKQTLEKEVVSADNKFLANKKIEEGWRLYDDGKYIEAVAMFSQAIGVDEKNSSAYYGRGTAYAKQRKYTQAVVDYNKAIKLNFSNAHIYHNRGNAYKGQGNFTQAILDYNKAIELNPKDAYLSYHNRGKVYVIQEKYVQALDDFTKSIDLNPNYANAYEFRGIVYKLLGNIQQAKTDFAKAKELSRK